MTHYEFTIYKVKQYLKNVKPVVENDVNENLTFNAFELSEFLSVIYDTPKEIIILDIIGISKTKKQTREEKIASLKEQIKKLQTEEI